MSTAPVARSARTHTERAVVHMETGDKLRAIGDEWFAVCYFYSAYHMVKAAMYADPIFDDMERCAAVHPRLTIASRLAEHHSGGFGTSGRTLGVSEVVFKLYKNIRVPYSRLHDASNQVRYGDGLGPISPVTVFDDFNDISRKYGNGEVVAPNVPTRA